MAQKPLQTLFMTKEIFLGLATLSRNAIANEKRYTNELAIGLISATMASQTRRKRVSLPRHGFLSSASPRAVENLQKKRVSWWLP